MTGASQRWTARRLVGRLPREGGLTVVMPATSPSRARVMLAAGGGALIAAVMALLAFGLIPAPVAWRQGAFAGLTAAYVLLLAGCAAALRGRWRQGDRRIRLYSPLARVRLTADGVCIAYQDAARAYRWAAFATFVETGNAFILRRHDGRVVVVPKPEDDIDGMREALLKGFVRAFRPRQTLLESGTTATGQPPGDSGHKAA